MEKNKSDFPGDELYTVPEDFVDLLRESQAEDEEDPGEEPLGIDPIAPEGEVIKRRRQTLFRNSAPKIEYYEFLRKLEGRCPNLKFLDSYGEVVEKARSKVDLITNFLKKAETSGIEFKKYEEEFLGIFERAIDLNQSKQRGNEGCDFVKEVATHDPRVILGLTPEKHPLEKVFEDRDRESRFLEILKNHLFTRAEDAWMLLKGFGLSMMARDHATIPVLLGPPAAGKSFLPRVLAQALREVGFKVEFLLVNAGVDHGLNDEFEMKLLGIDVHWSSASPGEIYRLSRGADLLIVVLDEIDKKQDRRFFLELFDTGSPLQDRCIRVAAPRMNLRPKVFFIGTANKLTWEDDEAFSSRVTVFNFEPYTREEKEKMVRSILTKNLDKIPPEIRREIVQILSRWVLDYDLDVRKALGLGRTLENLVRGFSPSETHRAREMVEKFLRKLYIKRREEDSPIEFFSPSFH